jgi:hypothetical protein
MMPLDGRIATRDLATFGFRGLEKLSCLLGQYSIEGFLLVLVLGLLIGRR